MSRSTSEATSIRSTRGVDLRHSQAVRTPTAGLLDIGDQSPTLEDRDGPRRLGNAKGHRVGRHRDRGGGLVTGAEPVRQGLIELAMRREISARAEDHAVTPDDERAVDRRELLERLFEL